MGAKVYSAIPCFTGSLHSQPSRPFVELESCIDFTADCAAAFDSRASLDATECIPAGSVRAIDFLTSPAVLLVAHVWRDEWQS